MAVVFVMSAPEPKAKPGVVAYSAAPLAYTSYVPSAAVVERSYHGNFAYPSYVSAPYVAASPYTYYLR
jgi:hypothetical protein